MLRGEAANTNYIVFGEHANHYTTDAVQNITSFRHYCKFFFPSLNIHVIAQCTLKLEIIPKYFLWHYILLNQTKKFRGHQYILLTVFKTDPNLHLACLSQRACWRISQSLIVPLLLLYTNKLHSNGWNSAAVITSVNSSILAGFISTISDTVKETIFL